MFLIPKHEIFLCGYKNTPYFGARLLFALGVTTCTSGTDSNPKINLCQVFLWARTL